MSIVRPGDYVAVGKTKRGSFIAYHLIANDEREYDDRDSFLFKSAWVDHDDDQNALISARRLLSEIAPGQRVAITLNNWWWDEGWRIFAVEETDGQF